MPARSSPFGASAAAAEARTPLAGLIMIMRQACVRNPGARRVGDFADKYFDLFVKYENVPGFGTLLERNDPGDRGGEYRSVIGIPGGAKGPLFSRIEEANAGKPGRRWPF